MNHPAWACRSRKLLSVRGGKELISHMIEETFTRELWIESGMFPFCIFRAPNILQKKNSSWRKSLFLLYPMFQLTKVSLHLPSLVYGEEWEEVQRPIPCEWKAALCKLFLDCSE